MHVPTMSSTWTAGSSSQASSEPILISNNALTQASQPGRRHRKISPLPGVYPGYDIFEIRPNRCLRIKYTNQTPRDEACAWQINRCMLSRTGSNDTRKSENQLANQLLTSQIHRKPNGFKQQLVFDEGDLQLPNTVMPLGNQMPNKSESWADNVMTEIDMSKSGDWTPRKQSKSHGMRTSTASSVQVRMASSARSRRSHNAVGAMTETWSGPIQQSNTNHANGDTTNVLSSSIQTAEDKDNCVIFFIHGVGGSADVWQSQLSHFGTQGYEVIVPDLIGHGFSSAPKNSKAYEFQEISSDLLAVFDAFCKTRNIVVGHSYGASFAAVLGRQRSQLVTKLVLISGGSPTPLAPQPGIFNLPTCMLVCLRPVLSRGFRKSAFHVQKQSVSQEEAFSVPTYVLRHIMNGQNWYEGNDKFHEKLFQPTLLIHGQQDRLVTIEEEEHMFKVIPHCQLVILENSSHMVMMERPEDVNQLIHSFILKGRGVVSFDSSKGDHRDRQVVADQHLSSYDGPMDREVMASRASLRSIKSIPSNLIVNNIG